MNRILAAALAACALASSAFAYDASELYGRVVCPGSAKFCGCPEDGRLKGVRIGSPLFRETVWGLPGHQCITSGPNGVFLVTPGGMHKIAD